MGTILGREPALILGAISAILNAAILLGAIVLDASQIAGLNILAAAVVAVVVRQAVTPVASPMLAAGSNLRTLDGFPATVTPSATPTAAPAPATPPHA